ncbi:MAG: hypothetical protein JEZ07_12835 [Phycisphaerae bacterium]|nr:hypothetical protein [Phycisphaerae bacterium]
MTGFVVVDATKSNVIAPEPGMADVALLPDLEWIAPTAFTPEGYLLSLGTDPNFTDPTKMILNGVSATTPYSVTTTLDIETMYYWRIDAIEPGAGAVQGSVWTFITGGGIKNAYPGDDAVVSVSPVFTWECTEAGLYIDSFDVSFNGQTSNIDASGTLEYMPSSLVEDTQYSWTISSMHGSTIIETKTFNFKTGKHLARWSMDNINFIDDISNQNGTVLKDTGGTDPNFAPGPKGNAARFNGTNLVVCGNDAIWEDTYKSLTISAWVKYYEGDTVNDNKAIVSKHGETTGYTTGTDGWALDFYDFRGTPSMTLCGIDQTAIRVSSTRRVDRGLWAHVVFVWDGKDRYMYINGELAQVYNGTEYLAYSGASYDKIATTGVVTPTTAPVAIGGTVKPDGTFFESFEGWLDEIQIFTYPVTLNEVRDIYASTNVATFPVPASGEIGVDWDPVLGWTPGRSADVASQKLYIADNAQFTNATVIDLEATASEADVANAAGNLELKMKYYWKIVSLDSSNNVIWPGYVWEFTVRELQGDLTDDGTTNSPDKVVDVNDLQKISSEWLANDRTLLAPVIGCDQEYWTEGPTDPNGTTNVEDYHDAPLATYGWSYTTVNNSPTPGYAQDYNAGDSSMYHDPGRKTLVINYNKSWGGVDGTASVTGSDVWSDTYLRDPIDTKGFDSIGVWVKKHGGTGSFHFEFFTEGWAAYYFVLSWVGNFHGLADDQWIYIEKDLTGYTESQRDTLRYIYGFGFGSWGPDNGWRQLEVSDIVLKTAGSGEIICWIGEDNVWRDTDINHDCDVNLNDFAIMAVNWLSDAR